jgi:signal recognition particle GTPase
MKECERFKDSRIQRFKDLKIQLAQFSLCGPLRKILGVLRGYFYRKGRGEDAKVAEWPGRK